MAVVPSAISVADLFLMKATYAWLPLLINFATFTLARRRLLCTCSVNVHFVNEYWLVFSCKSVCFSLLIRVSTNSPGLMTERRLCLLSLGKLLDSS